MHQRYAKNIIGYTGNWVPLKDGKLGKQLENMSERGDKEKKDPVIKSV